MRTVWITAKMTWREAWRRRFVIAAGAVGVAFLAVYALGIHFIARDISASPMGALAKNEGFNFFTLAGLYVVHFMYAMLAVLASADVLAGEVASGTIHALLARPVRRSHVLLGKWLALLVMMAAYLLLLGGGTALVMRIFSGYAVMHLERGLALLWLSGVILLSLSLYAGTRISALANGAMLTAAFGLALLGGWVEQIGSLIGSTAAVQVGIVSSLLIPSGALWRRAAYEMRAPVSGVGGFDLFTGGTSVPSNAMLVYSVLYAVGVLWLAVWSWSKRDL